MKKAIIFDMDGLMIDSKPTWDAAEKQLVEDYGKKYSLELKKKYRGLRVPGMIEVMIKEYKLPVSQKEGERKLRLYAKNNFSKPSVKLLPGCGKLVRSIYSSRGYARAIASSSPAELIETVVKRFKFDSFFEALVSAEDVTKGKPFPDVFLKAAELLGVEPACCLVLEDAPNGIRAAKAAGMKAIAVSSNPDYDEQSFTDADKFVKSLKEVNLDLIGQLLM